MDMKPIPAFYCCYLLRSMEFHASLYIGSTPNPVRRLAQHNGISTGGALRTARLKLRPWEMTCIVTGFPSKIAALQFEWAWQNPHLTKKIADAQRITKPKYKDKVSRKTGRTIKHPIRPKISLNDMLANLHLLLGVPGFGRWPLNVRFFCEDVYQKWQQWDEVADGSLRSGTKIVLDVKRKTNTIKQAEAPESSQVKAKRKANILGNGGIEDLNISYDDSKAHLEKSIILLAEDGARSCAICARNLGIDPSLALVCPREACKAVFHLACLASKFLEDDSLEDPIIPISGNCPECKAELQWVDLVKEMSLRARGSKEVAQPTRNPRNRKAKVAKTSNAVAAASQAKANDSENTDDTNAMDDTDRNPAVVADIEDDPLPDDWQFKMDDDDDTVSVTSTTSEFSDCMSTVSPSKPFTVAPSLKTVIEDSEWDDAESLT